MPRGQVDILVELATDAKNAGREGAVEICSSGSE